MAPMLTLAFLSFLSISLADDRAHGLASESPLAISPEAYAFFHPNVHQPSASNPCDSSDCSTMPLAATVRSAPAHESSSTTTSGGHGMGAGSIAGIILGFVFVCLVGMGAYYVTIKRRANLERTNAEQPEKV